MKPMIVGEAPSFQSDDYRPFRGPSGRRLIQLLDLESYDELADRFVLKNLLPEPTRKKMGATFGQAEETAWHLLDEARDDQQMILCGNWVWRAFNNDQGRTAWFDLRVKWMVHPHRAITVWHFPHPSGLSHFWNEPENVKRAADFLKGFLTV